MVSFSQIFAEIEIPRRVKDEVENGVFPISISIFLLLGIVMGLINMIGFEI